MLGYAPSACLLRCDVNFRVTIVQPRAVNNGHSMYTYECICTVKKVALLFAFPLSFDPAHLAKLIIDSQARIADLIGSLLLCQSLPLQPPELGEHYLTLPSLLLSSKKVLSLGGLEAQHLQDKVQTSTLVCKIGIPHLIVSILWL